MENKKYFLSLDIGTDSIGYAVTDTAYNLIRYKQHPMWGVHLFEAAEDAVNRRQYRTARRRLDRRQQRIDLLQEIFAAAVAEKDPDFFKRIQNSSLIREEAGERNVLFNDPDYQDREYHKQYPTIHHLILDLMENPAPHDVRLVYLACAWFLAHRGHFLSDVSVDDEICNFKDSFEKFKDFLTDSGQSFPWMSDDAAIQKIESALSVKGVFHREKALAELLYPNGKVPKNIASENFPYRMDCFIKLLSGRQISIGELFGNEEWKEIKLSLSDDDEVMQEKLSCIGDDSSEFILRAKELHDCIVWKGIMGSAKSISEAKVRKYEQHEEDLKTLKYFIRTYAREKYNEVFRLTKDANYVAYSKKVDSCSQKQKDAWKSTTQEDFCKYLSGILKELEGKVSEADKEKYHRMMDSIENQEFMPKQVSKENSVIPYQCYYRELRDLLKNAVKYLPFLDSKEKIEGTQEEISQMGKVLSLMRFRIPYYVGPLNPHHRTDEPGHDFAWIVRKANGPVYPWNLNSKVDLAASEQEFIRRMTNKCTYLPDQAVMPEKSLLYEKFKVLNFINKITVDGIPITVDLKQKLYREVFLPKKTVTKKTIAAFLKSNNTGSGDPKAIGGIDDTVTASLNSHRIFYEMFQQNVLSEEEAEEIINYGAFSQEKSRFQTYLGKFSKLTDNDRKLIVRQNFQNFGRLSRKFLTELRHTDEHTGASKNIIELMWENNLNLQELLSENFSFRTQIADYRKQIYALHPESIQERLDDMYVSNAVKRPIIRALTIVQEVVKAMGCVPAKVFVEMARDASDEKKKQRTVSRYEQLKQLYAKVQNLDIHEIREQLEQLGENGDTLLQSDRLFLYYVQLGKCMYSGESIRLDDLKTDYYEVDHIYPQSQIKDDSILNNRVLVCKQYNQDKKDIYPILPEIRNSMTHFWEKLLKNGLITQEKFARLTRSTQLSPDELFQFINRQLVETRQSTKVVAEILGEILKGCSEIVFVKAQLAADFRKEYKMLKSRMVNDLHHAKDAFLNIVVGNVYHELFTKQFFQQRDSRCSMKTEVLFGSPRSARGNIVWEGGKSLASVERTMLKNYIHLTRYSFCRHGKFFKLTILKKNAKLVPLKNGKNPAIYGGYTEAAVSFLSLVKITNEKSVTMQFVPVKLLHAAEFRKDQTFAESYIREALELKPKDQISFPLGTNPIKMNTVVELDDSYRFFIAGTSNEGKTLACAPYSPLILPQDWELYIKNMESYRQKTVKNPNLRYIPERWIFNPEDNLELFDLLCRKLQQKPFSLRRTNPGKELMEKRECFHSLCVKDQVTVLLNFLLLFSPAGRVGIDFSIIGMTKRTGASTLSSKVNNWDCTSARIIFSDASGLHESKSINLKEGLFVKKK